MRRAVACVLLSTLCGGAMAEWVLEHEDDYARRREIDTTFWSLETGFQRNQEKQYYSPGNASVVDGALRLEARREQVPNAAWREGSRAWRSSTKSAKYTSAALVAKRPLHYGRVEVVARATGGLGAWPAVWLVHEGAGSYGEIDIHEAVGKHPDAVFAAIHHGREPRTRKYRSEFRKVPGFDNRWHTHAVEWTPERITISLDGEPLLQADPDEAKRSGDVDPLRQPMVLRINLALGGSWGGPIDDARLPARFEIRSVRVWRWDPAAAAQARIADDAAAPSRGAAIAPASAEALAPAATVPVPTPVPGRTLRWGR